MPIHIHEAIPSQLIVVDLLGHVTESEFTELMNAPAPIDTETISHVICYTERLEKMPPLLSIVRKKRPDMRGWVIIVNSTHADLAGVSLAKVGLQVLGLRFRLVHNMAQAWEILQRVDPALDDHPSPPDDFTVLPLSQLIDHEAMLEI